MLLANYTDQWTKEKHLQLILTLYLTSALFYNALFSGTDEDAVLMLLAARSNAQRQEIKAAYKKTFGKVSKLHFYLVSDQE